MRARAAPATSGAGRPVVVRPRNFRRSNSLAVKPQRLMRRSGARFGAESRRLDADADVAAEVEVDSRVWNDERRDEREADRDDAAAAPRAVIAGRLAGGEGRAIVACDGGARVGEGVRRKTYGACGGERARREVILGHSIPQGVGRSGGHGLILSLPSAMGLI